MKTPGPDHPITLTPATRRWRATYSGQVIADTDDALILQEANYPAVVYFPRADVAMDHMSRTDRSTHCPYKGDAAYYTVLVNGHIAENAVWTYEHPYPAMALIEDRIAFYPDKVEIHEVDDATVDGERSVDEIVQHTDAGDGTTQREHWRPNVWQPD